MRQPKATHYAPSGMGGVFPVMILETVGERSRVRIIGCDDWNGLEFNPLTSELTPRVDGTRSIRDIQSDGADE